MSIRRRLNWIGCTVGAGLALGTALVSPPAAHGAELRTQVAEVAADGRIRLKLPAGHGVRVGDLVTISTEVPGIGRLIIETRWRIEAVMDGVAIAAPVGSPSGLPKPGFAAVIATAAAPADAAPTDLLGSYRARAEAGDISAMLILGSHYLGHLPLAASSAKPDTLEALRWLQKAAAGNNAQAACMLAGHYAQDPQGKAASMNWTRRAAQGGDAACMYRLGLMLLRGDGVAKNEAEAFAWIRKASDAGIVAAKHELAQLYLDGTGTRPDRGQALALLLELAKQRQPSAMFVAGILLLETNPAEGVKWLRAAADNNHPMATYHLGMMHGGGLHVAKSEPQARQWLERASKLNEPEAMYWLAYMYEHGIAGRKDTREAARLVMLALQAGTTQVKYLLREPQLWSTAFWRELQVRLRAAGVYKGAVDGLYGPQMIRAIEAIVKRGA